MFFGLMHQRQHDLPVERYTMIMRYVFGMYHYNAAPIERWSLGRVFAIVSAKDDLPVVLLNILKHKTEASN
jgi:hypothetical protein